MSEVYEPPFHMTDEITNLVIEIGELVGRLTVDPTMSMSPKLRKENRIRSIYSSLAIEQNTLSLAQVTDVIEGRKVLGPPKDILEVRNALEAYEQLPSLNSGSVDDLLKAHLLMMRGLAAEAGQFRTGEVGVYSNHILIHKGAPAESVPQITAQLFDWIRVSAVNPLIKSCIVHYEIEYIHPFMDGNGRIGRLWQLLILQEWKPVLAWLPVETLIHERQADYYQALNASDQKGNSTPFVTFMLTVISGTLRDICNRQPLHVGTNVGIYGGTNDGKNEQDPAKTLLLILNQQPNATARRLAELMHLSQRQVERILSALKQQGRIVRHGANKGGWWEVVK